MLKVSAIALWVNSVPKVSAGTNLNAIVLNIVDGDTLYVKINNRKEKIRLACVDSPESKQVGGVEATKFLSRLVPVGSEVIIVETGRDRYQRVVGVVFNGKTNVNLAMVSNGHAVA